MAEGKKVEVNGKLQKDDSASSNSQDFSQNLNYESKNS